MSGIPFENALKQSRAFGAIKADVKNGMGHAYLAVCADDDLLDSFFTLVAAACNCATGDACMTCAGCRKVLHGNDPDIYHVNLERKTIKVEDVKELLDGVYIRGLSGRKLYFVHRADLMNPASQNKLLKTLEEPPANVTLFLGVPNEQGLLETVRSRVRSIYIDSFDEQTIFDELVAMGKDEDRSAIAAACCDGMPGKALLIADSAEYAAHYQNAISLLSNLDKSGDVLKMSGAICAQKNVEEFLNVLSIIIRDMMVVKHGEDLAASLRLSGDIALLSQKFSERALAECLYLVNGARKKMKLNVNLTATADALLFGMLEARHKWQ